MTLKDHYYTVHQRASMTVSQRKTMVWRAMIKWKNSNVKFEDTSHKQTENAWINEWTASIQGTRGLPPRCLMSIKELLTHSPYLNFCAVIQPLFFKNNLCFVALIQVKLIFCMNSILSSAIDENALSDLSESSVWMLLIGTFEYIYFL